MRHAPATTLLVTIGLGAALVLSACTDGSTRPERHGHVHVGGEHGCGDDRADERRHGGRRQHAESDLDHPAGPRRRPRRRHPALVVQRLVTAGRWQFTDDPLNDPSVVGDPVAVPKTAFTPVLQPGGGRLYCVWRDPRVDVTNVVIDVAVVDSTKAFAALQQLSGFDCDRESEGYRCQKISQNPQYPVTDGDTYFTRGDIGIRITQSNVPTDGLLDDVEAHVFG